MSERSHRIDQTQALLYHARAATPFCSEDGEPCASVPSTVDSRRVLALRSASFRDWLTANFYSEYETAPSIAAFRAALRMLEARARYGEMPPQRSIDDGSPLKAIPSCLRESFLTWPTRKANFSKSRHKAGRRRATCVIRSISRRRPFHCLVRIRRHLRNRWNSSPKSFASPGPIALARSPGWPPLSAPSGPIRYWCSAVRPRAENLFLPVLCAP